MKITLIRAEKESGKEALSTLEVDALIKKLKTETKAGHVSTPGHPSSTGGYLRPIRTYRQTATHLLPWNIAVRKRENGG